MRPHTSIRSDVNAAQGTARSVATSREMTLLARLGYAMKGVVYVIIGWLAIQLAAGIGGKATDQRGALQSLGQQPFGHFLLIIVGIGLLGYALWSLIQAIFDTEHEGKKAKGIVARLAFAVVGISYGLLAIGAFRLVSGSGSAGQNTTTSTQDWTALLLKQPFGVFLVVLLGLIVIGVAGYLVYRAYKAEFLKRLDLARVSAAARKGVTFLGRLGYGAQAVVFVVIGIFLIIAAIQHNAAKAKGLDTALLALSQQPFGKFLLAIVALGFLAYGIYCFVEARYRYVGRG